MIVFFILTLTTANTVSLLATITQGYLSTIDQHKVLSGALMIMDDKPWRNNNCANIISTPTDQRQDQRLGQDKYVPVPDAKDTSLTML